MCSKRKGPRAGRLLLEREILPFRCSGHTLSMLRRCTAGGRGERWTLPLPVDVFEKKD